ncbi:MAG: PAS domain-containing protein [Methylacidiphilales bacterium]|nr:PAS domain-containing protein [Candidatus Methylacidiphilales bacterium]
MKLSFFYKLFILLVLGLVVVFVVDPLDPTTVSTPFCLGIVLMGLSLRQDTRLVVLVSLIYSILTVVALLQFHNHNVAAHVITSPYYASHQHFLFWLFQRIGLFLVLCAMAIYLSHYRTDTQRILTHVQDILAKLPAPVAISDAAGYIVFANEALRTAFPQEAAELIGKRYVDFFMTDVQEGKAMRYYIELFEEETNRVHEIEVKPANSEREAKIKGRLTCLGSGPDRVMITVLSFDQQIQNSLSK